MKVLRTIRDKDLDENTADPEKYKERSAARAVVFDADGNVALLHATKKHYHKLAGGGVESGEDIAAALKRELLEEIGCSVENVRDLGIIEEYRNKIQLHQLSYCYLADVVGEKGAPIFEEDERADGFDPVWLGLNNAIETLESEIGVEDYEGKFIQMRDLTFLQEAKKQIEKNES
ncbi:MAG: NUDIX domain-containing protein [bacterium]|nr:NUDIX domain-containing protein [bacterium]